MAGKLVWKIENFSCLKAGTIRQWFLSDWRVTIDPFSNSEYVSIQIKKTVMLCSDTLNFSVALLDSDGSPLLWREKKNISMQNGEINVHFDVIEKDTIFGSMRSKFLPSDTLRVQFLIWRTREELLNPVSFYYCSELYNREEEVIENTFHWNIANISSTGPDDTRSETELLTSEGVLKIRLFLGPSLRVKLSLSLWARVSPRVKCIVSVLDVNGKSIQFANEEHVFHELDEVWTFDLPITVDTLAHYRNKFLPNDMLSLVFKCTFNSPTLIGFWEDVREEEIFVDNSRSNVASPLTPAPDELENKQRNTSTNTISGALLGILEEGFMSDFCFRVQDRTFLVHKAILGARSSVFKAMFTADMEEKESGRVDVPDVDADTFKAMLNFIYSDAFEEGMQGDRASKLYTVADKYALEPLQQKCSRLLAAGLCASSVLDVLLLGDTHRDDDLKAAALDFIARNDKEIVATERWKTFAEENVLLAFDTIQKLYKKKMGV